GELLKKEREEAGLGEEKVVAALRVRKDYLEKIESDNYDELPPDVYVRGFLRNYAKLLDLDEKKVIEVYKHQREIKNHDQEKNRSLGKYILRKPPKLVITPEFFLGGISFLIVGIIALYFFHAAGNFSKPPRLEILSPKENETVTEEQILIKGRVDENSELEINGQQLELREGGEFETKVVLMRGVNEIIIKAKNKFEKITEKKITVNYKDQGDEETDLLRRKMIVKLKVDSESVWLGVESEEGNYSQTLDAYSEKILEINKPTKIIVGKANGVYFTVNDGDLEIFGESANREEKIFEP
ncbi:MAG: helix-turn-helix domain-containing protein, partial [Patescibacteria group bacterium]